jgi:death-on-curing protein
MKANPVFLELPDILRLHEHQIATYGGSGGIRDLEALESALSMPKAGMGDQYFHKGLPAMAAAYLFYLCQNHAFVDGNKRVAAVAAFSFLHMNKQLLLAPPDAFRDLVFATASGRADKAAITAFLVGHIKRLR